MKMTSFKWLVPLILAPLIMGNEGGCEQRKTSDSMQREQQERILMEGTAQVGMPAIKNFREKRLLKEILELRDQTGLVTYTYLENLIPTVVKGHTSLGGKLTFFCESIGYPIPYATQFTNPQRYVHMSSQAITTIAQADPNGLFSPATADGTWVMCKDPNGKDVRPVHLEPKLVGSPFRYVLD